MNEVIKECKRINNETDKYNKICSILNLQNYKPNSLYEETIINKCIRDNLSNIEDNIGDIIDGLNDIPYFSPDEIETFKNYYSESKRRFLDINNTIPLKIWREDCKMFFNGIISEDHHRLSREWLNSLYDLYYRLGKAKDKNELNIIKQEILDLGWNPNISFDPITRTNVSKHIREELKNKFNKTIYDISDIVKNINIDNEDIIQENTNINKKYPLYVVLSYTGTGFGKLISKYTNGIYSHAAIGLESTLDYLYSFNLKDRGFTIESINNYSKYNKDSIMSVYVFFLTKKDIDKVKNKLNSFVKNKDKSSYSILNILGIMANRPVELSNSMICSQFVDHILKSINIDVTNKNSALVTPNDLYNSFNPRIYKLYEGKIIDYNYKKVNKVKELFINKSKKVTNEMKSILTESDYLKSIYDNKYNLSELYALDEHCNILSENSKEVYNYLKPYIDIDYITEAKEFPVQFDKEGNLLIKKIKYIDYDYEYFQSHKLLLNYEETNNIEGMKYELSKLWFLNQLLEKKIYSENKNKDRYHKSRARILNDFNKYLKIVLKHEKDFIFSDYYNDSPFSDAVIKINKSTIYHGANLVKYISKLIVK